MRWLLTVILVLGLALFGMACQGEKEEKGEVTATAAATAAASPTAIAGAPDLPSGWTKIEPGGETICSQGTPFAYFVHPGTVNRLVVYFQGGGACWNAVTCSNPSIFDSTVEDSDNPEQ